MSVEFEKLRRLNKPVDPRPGDLWLETRLKHVILVLGANRTRGRRKGQFHYTYLYHFDGLSLKWSRDNWEGVGSVTIDGTLEHPWSGKDLRFLGNIEDKLPLNSLIASVN